MPSDGGARREIGVFLALLALLSSGFYAFVFLAADAPRRWLSYSAAFMWCPGLSALVTQLLFRRSLRGLGWGWGGLRYYLVAYAVPLAAMVPVYLAVWYLGLGGFNHERLAAARAEVGLPASLIGNASLALLALGLAPLGMAATLGEELGWRGFLVPRLAALTGFSRTSLVTGALWAAWHYPVVVAVLPVFIPRLPIGYALACFTVSVVAISFVYTWLRLASRSVWPAALLHATSNAFMGAFEQMTTHTEWTSYFTYEYGIGFSLSTPLIAFLFWRKRGEAKGPEEMGFRAGGRPWISS